MFGSVYLLWAVSFRDATGQTPFMLAVTSRAYPAALVLLTTIHGVASRLANERAEQRAAADDGVEADKDGGDAGAERKDRPKAARGRDNSRKSFHTEMIYPAGSHCDSNPLHVVCCNDTCSFTWTGAEHINQDIFECRTCGLTGSLCCCTECARVCHKGHDCKLKHTSPTAYCDCWEKCKCKALVAGQQDARFNLLCRLVTETQLVELPNARYVTQPQKQGKPATIERKMWDSILI